jgi:hypothetical protein
VKLLIGLPLPVVNKQQALVVGKMLLIKDRDIVMFSGFTHRTVLKQRRVARERRDPMKSRVTFSSRHAADPLRTQRSRRRLRRAEKALSFLDAQPVERELIPRFSFSTI